MVSPSPISSTGLATTETAVPSYNAPDEAVAFAMQQVGKPYVWGATGPDSYDCSGLTQASYSAAGVSIPRTTYEQCRIGTAIGSVSDAAPGDLIFPYLNEGHVVMYLGNNQIVEAPHPGLNVQVVDYYGAAGGIRRVTTQAGTGSYIEDASLSTASSGGPGTAATGQATSLLTALENPKDWTSFAFIAMGCVLLFLVGAQLIGKDL